MSSVPVVIPSPVWEEAGRRVSIIWKKWKIKHKVQLIRGEPPIIGNLKLKVKSVMRRKYIHEIDSKSSKSDSQVYVYTISTSPIRRQLTNPIRPFR